MKWGLPSTWGLPSLWGTAGVFCGLVEDRVLVQMDDAPANRVFRDLLCVLADGFETYLDVANLVKVAFDLSLASGEQLDAIGSVVGLPRQGYSDARYRTFLQIQIQLLLSSTREEGAWTGTHENLLSIVRTFVGAGPPTITLVRSGPYSFQLTIPGIVLSELQILIGFLCRAIYAGVLGQVIVIVAPDSLWNSPSLGPFVDEGFWGSATIPIAPSATWNFSIPIGSQPCD